METPLTNPVKHERIRTLVEAVKYFSDLNAAQEYFAKMRWPQGPVCPRCDSKDVTYSPKYRRFECAHKHPRRQFTVKTGTVMEDSPLGLDKWAVAFWLEVNAKNSISSYEIHRSLGITQKSAWFMLHRIRLAVKTGTFTKMGGPDKFVEADETFIGGLRANMHFEEREKKGGGRGTVGKVAVMGLLQRHTDKKTNGVSKVRATVLDGNTNSEAMQAVIHKHVEPGTVLLTDAHGGYRGLIKDYTHAYVDHAEKYVEGIVHTNGLENFWSLFKRCIKGTHVSIEPSHLLAYVDSEAFRFNFRDVKDGDRFVLALPGMVGKRLTYKALIGALGVPPTSGNDAGNANLPN